MCKLARYYDPAISRMLTQDTYRGEKNDPSSLHLYSYCSNNPINFVDPSGHITMNIKRYPSKSGDYTRMIKHTVQVRGFKNMDILELLEITMHYNKRKKNKNKRWTAKKARYFVMTDSVQVDNNYGQWEGFIDRKINNGKYSNTKMASKLKAAKGSWWYGGNWHIYLHKDYPINKIFNKSVTVRVKSWFWISDYYVLDWNTPLVLKVKLV